MGLLSLWSNQQVIPMQQSIYVLSEKDFAKYKQQQTKDEIAELERLVDGHKSSIERLETTIESLKNTLTTE